MSNSYRMSEVIQENKISSPIARNVETALIHARDMVIERLCDQYPKYTFVVEDRLSKSEINCKLRSNFDSVHGIGINLSCDKSHIRPDGGLIYLVGKRRKYLLTVIEGKHQGTNDRRTSEGKSEQARGNAIERSYKNFKEIQNYCLDEDIFSYLIFASGCDLERKGESIRDRLTAMTLGCNFNELYIRNVIDRYGRSHQRASVFIGIKDVYSLSNIMFEACSFAVEHYISKYSEEDWITHTISVDVKEDSTGAIDQDAFIADAHAQLIALDRFLKQMKSGVQLNES
jgi:hypothetical protein